MTEKHLAGKHNQQTHAPHRDDWWWKNSDTAAVEVDGQEFTTGSPRAIFESQGFKSMVAMFGAEKSQKVIDFYEGRFGDFTMSIDRFHVSADFGKEVGLSLFIEKDGKRVGSATRAFFADGEVSHGNLTLDRNQQGHGFGTEFYQRSEELYKELGMNRVTLRADSTIGGYAWALIGFDYRENTSREVQQAAADYTCQKLGLPPIRVGKAYELAALTVDVSEDSKMVTKVTSFLGAYGLTFTVPINKLFGSDGRLKLGKLIMVDTDWGAIKQLDNTETNEVARLYYQKKGKIEKHLAGKHDQDTHGGNKMSSTEIRRSVLSAAPDELDKLFDGPPEEVQRIVGRLLGEWDADGAAALRPVVAKLLPLTVDRSLAFLHPGAGVKLYRGGRALFSGSVASWTRDKRYAALHGSVRSRILGEREGAIELDKLYPGRGHNEIIAREPMIQKHLVGRHDQKTHGRSNILTSSSQIGGIDAALDIFNKLRRDTTKINNISDLQKVTNIANKSGLPQDVVGLWMDEWSYKATGTPMSNSMQKTAEQMFNIKARPLGGDFRVDYAMGYRAAGVNYMIRYYLGRHLTDGALDEDFDPDIVDRAELAADKMRQRFLQAIYDETQLVLKNAGITKMTVFRGTAKQVTNIDKPARIKHPALSSWSARKETASKFANVNFGDCLATTIPATRVFSLAFTGIGQGDEAEVVVLGGPITSIRI